MIRRFIKVNDSLYRGSAPEIEDLKVLQRLGIKKIVSLDAESGNKIDRASRLLGFKHIMIPIEIENRGSLLRFLKQDLWSLLISGGPTFLHCAEGKDRTGLAIALFRCKYQGWSAQQALKEAFRLGFGIGLPHKVVKLYEKLVEEACHNKVDINEANDIVGNVREQEGDYRDFTLDNFDQQTWSPYADYRVRQYPNQDTQNYWDEQYKYRNDPEPDDVFVPELNENSMPQIGTYDQNTQGINGAGPSAVGTGFV